MKIALIELLVEATNQDLGLIVRTEDASFLRAKLMSEAAGKPHFDCLSFTLSPTSPGNELWIIRRKHNAA